MEDLDEQLDDEDAGDEPAIAPSSFFGDLDDELAGLAVCTHVFRLYLRDSVARGFAEPEAAARELSRALHADVVARKQHLARAPRDFRPTAPPTVVHRDIKPPNVPEPLPDPPLPPAEVLVSRVAAGETESAERAQLRTAHGLLSKRLGRVPSARELFEELGEDAARSPQNVRIGAKRAGLELTSERGGGRTPYQVAGGAGTRDAKAARTDARSARTGGGRRATAAVRRCRRFARHHGAAERARSHPGPARRSRRSDRATPRVNGKGVHRR